MLLITRMRRERLKGRPFPAGWPGILEETAPLYRRLPLPDREELHGHMQVFLGEKNFEGAGGMAISDRVRITITAQACLLLLHRQTDYYPGLSSIVVYPGEYSAPYRDVDEWGIVTEGADCRSGETCRDGALVLSWEDVAADGIDVHPGYNVVLHEFAHLLDAEEGLTTGTPLLARHAPSRSWGETLRIEFEQLRSDAARNRPTLLDPYGAESLEEFFAVATEAFFEIPQPFRERHPDLYGELSRFYRQDPASWPARQAD